MDVLSRGSTITAQHAQHGVALRKRILVRLPFYSRVIHLGWNLKCRTLWFLGFANGVEVGKWRVYGVG